MKRFWPVYLALFCWLLVAIVPATRHNLWAGWENWTAYAELIGQDDARETIATPDIPATPQKMSPWSKRWNEQHPGDKRAELFAAMEDCDSGHCEALARRYPRDASIIALRLGSALPQLSTSRTGGPISNLSYPEPAMDGYQSPPGKWLKFIDLARQGCRLEPSNCFFDIMLLKGLYALKRDDEARHVLKAASRKTIYDTHERDLLLNTERVLHFVYDMPPPPLESTLLVKKVGGYRAFALNDISRWTMDLAVNDRQAGRHQRALDTTLDLVKLCRTVRGSGISIQDSRAGFDGEEIALTNMSVPNLDGSETQPYQLIEGGLSLELYKVYSRSLYEYAKDLHRDDIAELAVREWGDLHGSMKIYATVEKLTPRPEIVWVKRSHTLQFLLLRSCPFVLLLGAICGLLTLRFAAPVQNGRLYWHGAIGGIGLLALGLVGLLVLNTQEDQLMNVDYQPYFLIQAERFILIGFPAVLLCLALFYAGHWQHRQQHPPVSLKTRLKNLTAPAADGLARFDFGWIIGVILIQTYVLMVLASMVMVTLNYYDLSNQFSFAEDALAFRTLVCIVAPFLIARLISWFKLPRKRETLLLGFRYTFQVISGYLIGASVVYAVLVFVTLGVNLHFLREFEKDIWTGELKITRAAMGLK